MKIGVWWQHPSSSLPFLLQSRGPQALHPLSPGSPCLFCRHPPPGPLLKRGLNSWSSRAGQLCGSKRWDGWVGRAEGSVRLHLHCNPVGSMGLERYGLRSGQVPTREAGPGSPHGAPGPLCPCYGPPSLLHHLILPAFPLPLFTRLFRCLGLSCGLCKPLPLEPIP